MTHKLDIFDDLGFLHSFVGSPEEAAHDPDFGSKRSALLLRQLQNYDLKIVLRLTYLIFDLARNSNPKLYYFDVERPFHNNF